MSQGQHNEGRGKITTKTNRIKNDEIDYTDKKFKQ